MSSDSFQLLGMAERGFLPAVLAKRSRFGTPTLGIVLSSLGICSLVTFNFLQVEKMLIGQYTVEFRPCLLLGKLLPGHPQLLTGGEKCSLEYKS